MSGAEKNLWFEHALLPEGWRERVRLTIASGRVAKIETNREKSSGDDAHTIAVPGLANLHSHAFQRGMAGLAETRGPSRDSFWTWREVMYRFVGQLDPDQFEAVAAMAFTEMLESGFTRVGEFHYLHHDKDGVAYADRGEMAARVAAAAQQIGIGLTLLPVLYAHSGFGGLPPNPGQKRFIHGIDEFALLLDASRKAVVSLDDAIVGVAPHSLRAVTADELKQVALLAGDAPIHIHIAEQMKEVEDCVAWCGRRPVQFLLDTGLVNARWCLVHATHSDGAELEAIAKSSAVVGLCPITEANLGDGVFPAAAFVQNRGRFGVGSDSNILIDAAEELRILEYGQRLTHRSRNVLASVQGASTGGDLYRAALAGGAQALGVGGGIKVGASADLISLDPNQPAMSGRKDDSLLDSWIFAARGGAVDSVWRYGKKIVSQGRHIARDTIATRYRKTLATLV